jgi:hypothetical protein
MNFFYLHFEIKEQEKIRKKEREREREQCAKINLFLGLSLKFAYRDTVRLQHNTVK